MKGRLHHDHPVGRNSPLPDAPPPQSAAISNALRQIVVDKPIILRDPDHDALSPPHTKPQPQRHHLPALIHRPFCRLALAVPPSSSRASQVGR